MNRQRKTQHAASDPVFYSYRNGDDFIFE